MALTFQTFMNAQQISFEKQAKSLAIAIAGTEVALYTFADPDIPRPYFAHVKTAGGIQVTRNYPPAGDDPADHATYHPGLWLAFGDLSGADFWRNKATVRHEKFVQEPRTENAQGSFVVENMYESDGREICRERCTYTIHAASDGWLLTSDSTFTTTDAFTFGDQEEMGFGIRVATPLIVKNGGAITNSDGGLNEAGVWGRQADWAAYGGKIGDTAVSLTLMPHPQNFGRSWFHARDYGLLVANPFGRNAFTKESKSSIRVLHTAPFRLRFGLHIGTVAANSNTAYMRYVELSNDVPN